MDGMKTVPTPWPWRCGKDGVALVVGVSVADFLQFGAEIVSGRLLFDVDARGAEGAPFESAVLVRPVDRVWRYPNRKRRRVETPERSSRHRRA
jgi:hypothetical protein